MKGITAHLDRVESVAVAKKVASEKKYDLAMLDLHLLDSTGIMTIAQFYPIAQTLKTAIVSGASDERLKAVALAAGYADFLQKSELSKAVFMRLLERTE